MRVFVTGGANGIGKAATTNLLERGHEVAVLDVDGEALASLPSAVDAYEADVADREDVTEIIEGETFDVLVNNAGFMAWGSIEDVSPEIVSRHFETNVFGLLNATQAALPMLRERNGRVVNVSSMGGHFTAPYWGIYSATKHAVRAISDELRLEMADFDVDVVTVEPGPITTGFNEGGRDRLEMYLPDSVYADAYRAKLEAGDLGGGSPESAGAVVARAATTNRPRVRYRVTWYARLLPKLKVLLPERVWDSLARRF